MIAVVGSCCVDELLYLDFLPKSSQDAKILKREMRLGGCAYYVAKAIKDCTLISSIGKGIYASYILDEIDNEEFECIFIPRTNDNGVCICAIEPNGERTFLSLQGAEYDLSDPLLDEVDDFDWVYLSGIDLEINKGCISYFKNNPKQLFFSPGPRFENIENMDAILDLHPVLHMNRDECYRMTHKDIVEGMEALYNRTQSTVFVTDGKNGSYAYDGSLYFVPSIPIRPKNTVGAGDSHAGICLKGLAENKEIKSILQEANTYASHILSEK